MLPFNNKYSDDIVPITNAIKDVVELIDDKVKAIMLPNLIGNKPDWKFLKE